ncbi:MAG: type I-A CRISPR-associated protein Cas5a [Conexivisphaerales archaeon]
MKEHTGSMEILGVHISIPLYTIRDPGSWGIRLSFLLPPPRTLIGALAHGLGVVYGIASGEENLKGEFARNVLSYALETYSFVTIRPLSPLVKTSQIMRLVPAIEKGKSSKTSEEAHDAFKTDFIFCSDLKAVYTIDIDMVNLVLEKYGLPKADIAKLSCAARFIDRIGQTESICYVKNIEWLETKGRSVDVNTYLPTHWIEDAKGDYNIGELLPNIRILEDLGEKKVRQLGIESIKDKDLRKKKIPFLLPLRVAEHRQGREVLKPVEVNVKLKTGYVAYLLDDGTKIVLPS